MNYAAYGRLDGTRTHIARLRNGSPVLVRGQGDSKMVGETGFAPARACALEFLRLVCILIPPLADKNWCGWGDLHAHAPEAQRFLKPPGLLFHTQPHGRGGRTRTGTGVEAQRILRPLCILIPTTPRKIGANGGSRTLMSLRSPASRAGAYAIPPRPQK